MFVHGVDVFSSLKRLVENLATTRIIVQKNEAQYLETAPILGADAIPALMTGIKTRQRSPTMRKFFGVGAK